MTGSLDTTKRAKRISKIKADLRGIDETLGSLAWRWGTLLREVDRDELWRDDGRASFGEWLDMELEVSRRTGERAILVATHFNEDMAARFGGRKLAAAIDYIELTARKEKPGDILALGFKERGPDGKYRTVPFAEASGRRIERAVASLRLEAAARDRRAQLALVDKGVHERARDLAGALPAAPSGTVRGDRVTVKKGKDGALALTIQGIPLSGLDAALDAVRAHFASGPGGTR